MKIGELAQATKISIRTLHHYDEVGLLKPSNRTESGHRLYSEADIARLHKIVSLRNLDFSLDEISKFIGYSQEEMQDLISRQSEKMEAEREELDRKQWCIQAVQSAARLEPYQGREMLIDMIRELSLQSEHFTPAERQLLYVHKSQIPAGRVKQMHDELAELTERVQGFMNSNTEASDPRVIQAAKEWLALGKEGTGDRPEIQERVRELFKKYPDLTSYRGITPELRSYLRTALHGQS